MRPTMTVRTLLVVMLAAIAVGALDAIRSSAWDLVGIFVALAAGTLYLLLRTTARRPLVPVRGDLARWLEARAAETGERVTDLTDRALSAYRADLVGDDADGDGDGG